MIPATIFGSLALLTSLGITENENNWTREEARVELLGCITRNFLGIEGATSSEIFRREILSRCRPQLPACSTITNATQLALQSKPQTPSRCVPSHLLVP